MGEPFFFPTPTAGAGAPKVDDGLALWRFDDVLLKTHDDWAGTDQYGNPDDGRRFHFVGTIMEDLKTPKYGEDGDPIQIERVTRTATGKRSNFRAVFEGLLTAEEFKDFISRTEANPYDGSKVRGRVYNIKVTHSASGWPQVEDIIGIAK